MISESLLLDLGIVDWGYTEESEPLSYPNYKNWLDQNLHGKLNYLADERGEKRASLKNLFPEFQSALVFLFDYKKEKKWLSKQPPMP